MKKKSLLVALLSSFLVSCAIVLTFIGYVLYIELKDEELKLQYKNLIQKVNARLYSKNIEISRLSAKLEDFGPLKGNIVLEGAVKNNGLRTIESLLIKVRFLDKDGAILYEVTLYPQEPALGYGGLSRMAISYLRISSPVMIKPNGYLPFKKILYNCPREIAMEIRDGAGFAKGSRRWPGKFDSMILSVGFNPE